MDNKIINPIEKIKITPPQPEGGTLSKIEKQQESAKEIATSNEKANATSSSLPTAKINEAQQIQGEQLVQQIENILAEDLGSFYQNLDSQQKVQFRQQGEETARQINTLLGQAKIKINQIIKLIINWLKMVPGLNKFFIEQSAKIKSDKILVTSGKIEDDH